MKSLNIKDPQTHALAAQLAQLTGESLTSAVREAVKERLERVQHRLDKPSKAELRAIAHEISQTVQRPYEDHATLLYDEYGLPK